jgi:hypothetical protein
MQVTNNLKIELFTALSEEFPDKANEVIKVAQDICLKEAEFGKLSEDKQADLIIDKIFDDPNLLGEDVFLFLEINNYLKKLSTSTLTDDFLNEVKNINKQAFFQKDSVNRAYKENDIEEIEALLKILSENMKKITQISISASQEIKPQIDFLSKIDKVPNNASVKKLKEELQKNYNKMIDFQNKLAEISKDNRDKYKQVQEQLIKINNQSDKDHFLTKINNVTEEFKKVFAVQEKLINQAASFQMLPMEQILDFPDIVNEFATYMMSYPVLRSMIKATELNSNSGDKAKELKSIEEELLNNFKIFVEKTQKSFEKGMVMDVKDKNKTFKHKFIEPLEAKFDPDSLQILLKLIDSVF